MTTSDRAGNEERLREALDEVLRPYLDLAGMNAETIDKVLAGATARLSSFHGIAALAAAPTQSGAEGPARDYGRLNELRDSIIEAVRTQDGVGGIKAFAAYDDFLHAEPLAALRSGAEVAAAPGLDARTVTSALRTIMQGTNPVGRSADWWRLRGEALAARLTAKP